MSVWELWDHYLTERDRTVCAWSGLGRRQGLGARIALLIIDVTVNFCGDRREPLLDSIPRWRNSCGEAAWDAADRIAVLLDHARAVGIPVLYSAGLPTDDNPVLSGRWRDKNSRRDEDHDRAHQDGHDIIETVAPVHGEIVVRKTKPSVFYGTPLESYLIDLGIDTIITCGGSTSGCVRATVLDGFSRNYRMMVAADGCFDRFEASHALTLFDLDQKYADVMFIEEVCAALKSGATRNSSTRDV
jgi:nicotinamidase-related amidase